MWVTDSSFEPLNLRVAKGAKPKQLIGADKLFCFVFTLVYFIQYTL